MSHPRVVLAADHRARGILTFDDYGKYLDAARAALPYCDALMASTQPLADLVAEGAVTPAHRTYLSLNRTGLAGSAFELDDRLVATVEQAAREGYTGVKHMTRIDLSDPHTAPALELLGRVLEEVATAELDAMIEPLVWRDGAVDRSPDAVRYAAVVANDLGAPLLKVPVPEAPPGEARAEATASVVAAVGVPVLVLGGPRPDDREALLSEVRDAVAGGAAGVAVGRAILQDADPGAMAALVREVVG